MIIARPPSHLPSLPPLSAHPLVLLLQLPSGLLHGHRVGLTAGVGYRLITGADTLAWMDDVHCIGQGRGGILTRWWCNKGEVLIKG